MGGTLNLFVNGLCAAAYRRYRQIFHKCISRRWGYWCQGEEGHDGCCWYQKRPAGGNPGISAAWPKRCMRCGHDEYECSCGDGAL